MVESGWKYPAILSQPGSPLSGLSWTMPKGACAPGYVLPVKSVPIIGSTADARQSVLSVVPADATANGTAMIAMAATGIILSRFPFIYKGRCLKKSIIEGDAGGSLRSGRPDRSLAAALPIS